MDPSAFGTFNLGQIVGDVERVRTMRANRQMAEQDAERKRRLADLLPTAMGMPGGMGEGGAVPSQQDAMREIAGIDPELFMRLDDRQKQQAKAELVDVTAAVRWADTPEKWAQVQQYYGPKGIDLSEYTVADRERAMLRFGKIGEYLESAPKMEIRTVEPGGSAIGFDPRTGQAKVLVQPNAGGQQMGAPSAPPRVLTDDDIRRMEGGQSGSAPTGGFR